MSILVLTRSIACDKIKVGVKKPVWPMVIVLIFLYSVTVAQTSAKPLPVDFKNFVTAGIKRIIFDRGGLGCTGGHKNVQVYDLRKKRFELVDSTNNMSSWDSVVPSCPKTIKLRRVEEFIEMLPVIYSKHANISELGFTKAEYDSCKQNILKYKASIAGNKDE